MRRRFSLAVRTIRATAIFLIWIVPTTSARADEVSNVKYGTLNSSAAIAAGNTFQTILAAVTATRRSITIENNNLTDNCWLFIGSGSPTKQTSILLTPGGSYTRYFPYIPFEAIQATCATAGDTLYVDTQ